MKKFMSYLLTFIFAAAMAIMPLGVPAHAGSLGVIINSLSLPNAMYSNTAANHSISFTASTAIPAGGKILVTYPAGFGLANVTASTNPAVSGTTWNVEGQTVKITLGSGTIPAGSVTVNLGGVDNANQGSYSVTVETRDANDATLDGPADSFPFAIRGPVSNYSIVEPSYTIVNQTFTLTVIALDSAGYVTMGSANVRLSAQTADGVAGSGALAVTSVDTNNANGYATISQSYSKPETIKIRANDGSVGDVGWNNISPAIKVDFVMTKLSISPASATKQAGQSQQFTATAGDDYGNSFDVTNQSSWSTTDPRASLTQSGLYTAGSVGNWKVKAAYNGFEASASVNVTPGPANSVTINPTSATLTVGQTKQFSAQAFDQYGNLIPNASFSWSVNNGNAQISQSGLLTAKSAGNCEVTVTSNGKSAKAQVQINAVVVYNPEETATATPTAKVEASAAGQKETEKTQAELEDLKKAVAGANDTTQKKDNTVEKIVFTVVALALLGLAAYFLFRKEPEEKATVEIQKPEDIIRQITEKEAEIKKQHEANLKKDSKE